MGSPINNNPLSFPIAIPSNLLWENEKIVIAANNPVLPLMMQRIISVLIGHEVSEKMVMRTNEMMLASMAGMSRWEKRYPESPSGVTASALVIFWSYSSSITMAGAKQNMYGVSWMSIRSMSW